MPTTMMKTVLTKSVATVSTLVQRIPQALAASSLARSSSSSEETAPATNPLTVNDTLTAKDYHPDFSLADRQIEQTVLLIENNMLDIQKNYHPVTKEVFLNTKFSWAETSFQTTPNKSSASAN